MRIPDLLFSFDAGQQSHHLMRTSMVRKNMVMMMKMMMMVMMVMM